MIDAIGNVLNWALAGLFYPVMMIPLAVWVSECVLGRVLGRLSGQNKPALWLSAIVWFGVTMTPIGLGALFLHLLPTPMMSGIPPSSVLWFAAIGLLAIAMAFSGGPRVWMDRLTPWLDKITSRTGRGVTWLLLLMALVQFLVVLLRHVFGLNYIAMQESITYVHGAVFLLAGGYALLTHDHVRVDLFYREASDTYRARVNFWGTYGLLIPVCFLIIWAAGPYVFASWVSGEGSAEASGLQILYILKSFIPAFAVLMLMAAFCFGSRCVPHTHRTPTGGDHPHPSRR